MMPEPIKHRSVRKPPMRYQIVGRRLTRLDRIVSLVSYVVSAVAILLMFVIAFVPWTLFWLADKLSP